MMKLFVQTLTFATLTQQAQCLLTHFGCPPVVDAIEGAIDGADLPFDASCGCNIKLDIFHGLQIQLTCAGEVFPGAVGTFDVNTRKKKVTADIEVEFEFTPTGASTQTVAGASLTVTGALESYFNPTQIETDRECQILVTFSGRTVPCDGCVASGSLVEIPDITPMCDNLIVDFIDAGVGIGDLITVISAILEVVNERP